MIGILIAIKSFLEIDAVVGALGALDAGLNVATLFGILKSKLPKDSMERQMISALDESLKESCKKLGWHYDSMAAYMWLDVETVLTTTAMTKESLKESLEKLTGKDISERDADVFIDCFDKSVAGKPELFRYLNQKWMRYIGKDNPTPEFIPITLTTISSPVELIGREDDITAIRNALTKNNVISIRADGGVGKTAVATKIVNDVKEEIERGNSQFKHVAWITSTGNLKNDLSKLEIPAVEAAGSFDEKFQQASRFLKEKPTFLVIDNMDNPPNFQDAENINTISGSTKILITTRTAISRFKPYPLKEMDKQDVITLFYKHYFNSFSAPSWQEIENRSDMAFVEKIIDASTCNALLIELIAKMACWEYTDKLKDLWDKLEEQDVFGVDSEDIIETDHADSHLSVVDKKLQGQIRNLYRISILNDTQQELMRFFAVFPPQAVIFADVFKWAGFKVADLKYLTERGWIEKAGDGFLIHTMVKGSIELQDGDFDIEKYENMIEELINTNQYIPEGTVYTKVHERIVVPETVCRLLLEKGDHSAKAASLFNNIGFVYQEQGDYTKALKYYEKACLICKEVKSLDHPYTGALYNNIAVVYTFLGAYSDALEYYEKACVIREKELGQYHPETANTYSNIAVVYDYLGKYTKALEYNSKARRVREKVLGLNHPETAETYDNIGIVYENLGNYRKALYFYEKACVIHEKVLGPHHPRTATMYSHIAGVYDLLGQYKKALEYYEKVRMIREKVLGPHHPRTATMYNNIAAVYGHQGDYERVLEFLEKACVIREKALGLEHPETAMTYNNIASAYGFQGDYDMALVFFEKARVIFEKVLGQEHPETAMTYNNLAAVYGSLENYDKALEFLEKARVVREKVLGFEHAETANTYNNIANTFYHLGDYLKALEYFEKTCVIREKALEPYHLDTAKTYYNLGFLHYELQNYEESKKYSKKAYNIYLEVLGGNHPNTNEAKDLLEKANQKLNNE